jgi:putative transposase
VAENLCLRQQLLVLRRRQLRPRLSDRRFWILASRWFPSWRDILVVSAATVLRWHRRGWKAYWRRRSRRGREAGRRPIAQEVQALIRRMAGENRLWGQRRIQAELARLGFKVSARTVAKYMHRPNNRRPSPSWRPFLTPHASTIWARDFFCFETILFLTLYVFFVIHHASRQILHIHVTSYPTAEWTGQQIVECCGWYRAPPRFLIHDRDSIYGAVFDRRVRSLGISQVRTPFRWPRGQRNRGALGEICQD